MQACSTVDRSFSRCWKTFLPHGTFNRRTVDLRQHRSTRFTLKAQQDRSEVVIPSRSFNLPIGFLGLSALSYYTTENIPLTAVLGILGIFLGIQATRVKFIFSKDTLEVELESGEKQENVFVGGENKWTFKSFVNWELWWPSFPILVYFKETQTKPEGQIHFFPVLFNGKEIYNVMVERCGPSQNSLPK